MVNKSLVNRYVIALNRSEITEIPKQERRKESESLSLRTQSHLTYSEVAKIMDIARQFPKVKIDPKRLFTCGFAVN